MFAGGYCDDEDDNDDGDADVIREITTLLIVKVNETCYMLSLARIEDGSIYTCVPPVLLQKQMGKCILLLCYWNILSFSSVPLERCLDAIKSGWPGSEKRVLSGPGQMPEA
ncbi:hypothetical protein RUM44_011761 [Polyplax serrata]|uniref:Uncharacterized protein n=1 Tax=Polyplax serrata TaxID=468196 RepID=A0ABR1AQZ3_POLSC